MREQYPHLRMRHRCLLLFLALKKASWNRFLLLESMPSSFIFIKCAAAAHSAGIEASFPSHTRTPCLLPAHTHTPTIRQNPFGLFPKNNSCSHRMQNAFCFCCNQLHSSSIIAISEFNVFSSSLSLQTSITH